jgi:bacillithiol system protein YtxJ
MSDFFHPLASEADWATALEQSDETPVLVFKHSSACSVSAKAQRELEALTEEVDVPVYRVVVQQHRQVSNTIEDALGIRHETPQAILLHDRSPVFDTSHFDVRADALHEELQSLPVAPD